ncbi:MAG TPA: kelch repeat-containing protein [Pyrinomonadaceae bacterium]|nr:kelch repeat-containing protein [Pyrinomonadaceae bacterium]
MIFKFLFVLLLANWVLAPNCNAVVIVSDEPTSKFPDAGNIDSLRREMNSSRAAHTATLLPDGRVLVAGGFAGDENSLASAEIFDPKTNEFSPAGRMSVARSGHSATLLPGGKILIAGGYNGDYLDSAEIYDPKTGKFTPTGKMTLARSGQTAVLLDNGKVLLAGGVGTGWTFLADAELYDPSTGTFTKTGNMLAARESHTATLLKDGRVLITGGHRGRRAAITIYSSAEIYNPASGTFIAAPDLTVKRHKHDALLLNDGRVLIVGGSDERDARGAYSTVEIYNPKTSNFTKIGDMNLSRYKLQGTTILLKNGKILIAGGANRAEVFNPAKNTFEVAEGKFETARLFATATLLPNGQVLIIGGYDNSNAVSNRAWIYKS